MPQLPSSTFLETRRPLLKAVLDLLGPQYDYISLLATDDAGLSFRSAPGETEIAEPLWVQRGLLFRAQRAGRIAELALNEPSETASGLAARVSDGIDVLFASNPAGTTYPSLPDEEARAEFHAPVEQDPFSADPATILDRLTAIRDRCLQVKTIASARTRADFVRVSRLFLSPHRELCQSYLWSQAYIFGVARRDALSKGSFRALSGRKGLEILDELENRTPSLLAELEELLGAVKIEPGEYEVILAPDIAGTLAHESFGHGVELDMFVKGRAKAAEYLGKAVASPLVTMYDGAAKIEHTGSFLFDDEGTLASEVAVIEKGIFRAGLADLLSAAALGLPATGNGRREAYDHKAYARMTNTYFAPGKDRLEDMIAKIRRGWLIDRLNSGMEDPKNWGIQLVALVGREILDGKLTGRVASPVICSGSVPEVLSAIDMVSGDFELSGSGACGKGHKEFAKVSSGGPYVKTRMRLG